MNSIYVEIHYFHWFSGYLLYSGRLKDDKGWIHVYLFIACESNPRTTNLADVTVNALLGFYVFFGRAAVSAILDCLQRLLLLYMWNIGSSPARFVWITFLLSKNTMKHWKPTKSTCTFKRPLTKDDHSIFDKRIKIFTL